MVAARRGGPAGQLSVDAKQAVVPGQTARPRRTRRCRRAMTAAPGGPPYRPQWPQPLPSADGQIKAPDRPSAVNLTVSETALPRRVLLVDDNRDASSSLAELLRMLGHEVVVADDGPASLSLVDAGQAFDVALLDIGLPGMCGHELARLLRQRFAPSTLRLVALTGYGTAPGLSARHHNGFDDYFVKPVDIDALQASIHKADRTAT